MKRKNMIWNKYASGVELGRLVSNTPDITLGGAAACEVGKHEYELCRKPSRDGLFILPVITLRARMPKIPAVNILMIFILQFIIFPQFRNHSIEI